MAPEDDNRVNDLRMLIERLTGILDEASTLRQRLEQSLADSRSRIEHIGERKRRLLKGRRRKAKPPAQS